MNGELAQVIALATHGTKWLRDPSGPPPHLERSNSTFQYVRSVAFRDERPRGVRRGVTVSASVEAWLGHLRDADVDRLWLVIPTQAPRIDDHTVDADVLTAFAGEASWLMVATATSGASQWWGAQWEVGDHDGTDQRIWEVRYRGLATAAVDVAPRPAIPACAETLGSALAAAHDFADTHDLSPWTDLFGGALETLSDGVRQPPYHPDVVPPTYPEEALRLLAAAAQSWVFGGMGSWNDLGFVASEDDARYRHISRALYDAVLASFVAVVNVDL